MDTQEPIVHDTDDTYMLHRHKNNDIRKREETDNATHNNKKMKISGIVDYEPKRFDQVVFQPRLPNYEMYIYYSLILGSFAYGLYSLYDSSREYSQQNETHSFLLKGWSFISNKKDYSDYEWFVWTSMYKKLIYTQVLHAVVSLTVTHFAYKYRRHAWLGVSFVCMFYILGWRIVIAVAAITTSFYLVSLCASIILTWSVAFAWTTAFSIKGRCWMGYLMDTRDSDVESTYGVLFFSITFLVLRLISFAIEKTKRHNKTSDLPESTTFTFFDMLVYAIYLPNYYFGPVFIYKYYALEVIKPQSFWTKAELLSIIKKLIRCIIWFIYCDLFLHFCYIHIFADNKDLLNKMPIWSIGAMVGYFSSFYQAKYCVTYGFPAVFMMIDKVEPPSNPRCIVRVVYFSEYWRYFDPGLHGFWRNYIYIPLGGSRHGIIRQVFATFCTFLFVSYWHGFNKHIIAWTMTNCLAVCIEMAARMFVDLPAVKQFEMKYFGPLWTRRLHALCNVPLYMFSIHGILIFYSNYQNAFVYFQRIVLYGGPVCFITMYTLLYMVTIFSQEVDRWERTKLIKSKDT